MPARDIFHNHIKHSLIKDGWEITHDPLRFTVGRRKVYIDLGAHRLIAARKGKQKIAVEVKSFVSKSEMADLENAMGQFLIYQELLAKREPNRVLYLAIRQDTYRSIFEDEIGQILLESEKVKLIVFDPETEVILQWIPPLNIVASSKKSSKNM